MPNLIDKDAAEDAGNPKALFGYGLPSAPVYSFDVPLAEPPAEESIFHPVRAVEDILSAIHLLTQEVNLLVKAGQRELTFVDRSVQIGATINYTVDFLEHRYLYILAPSNVTLNISTGGTLAITANVWTNISFPRGTSITVSGGSDTAPGVFIIRAGDVYMG